MSSLILEPGSFRDKSSRVFYQDARVFRALSLRALERWNLLQSKSFYTKYVKEKKIVQTQQVSIEILPEPERTSWAAVLEHDVIPFVSYPYEWSFGMLKDAAILQLELLEAALKDKMTMKDASSFNIQWKGTQPVFIDIPSFIERSPGTPWSGYRQFCELFLFPLLLQAYRNIPFQPWLRGSLDGISPETASRLLARDFYKPGVLMDVLLHARFERRYARTQRHVKEDIQKAGFTQEMVLANVTRLAGIISRLTWKTPRSHWIDYSDTRSCTTEEEEAKRLFVDGILKKRHRKLVWDFGCNMGEFSRLAAKQAVYVVAIDSDAQVIEAFYQSLKAEPYQNILPLVANLADLSSGLGWQGRERKAFVDRARPELILCLALVHHVAIGSNIPLEEWVQWLSSFKSELVIEFVTPEDPMVQQLLRNKDENHDDYTTAHFESVLSRYFTVKQREAIKSGCRVLYACEAKS
jgi:2-polyprenyl-3-methyl-5-hydroxy-6-metoxy-1,4-benzoquinol methylase